MPDDRMPEEVDLLDDVARRRRLTDLAEVMGTAAGRRFVHALVYERAGALRLGWSGDSSARAYNDFWAGARQIGLGVLADLQEACPKLARQMDDEAAGPPTPTP